MTAVANPKLSLRPFLAADIGIIAEIFRASVDELAAEDYSDGQRGAWIAVADDEEGLAARLAGQLTLLGMMDGSPVGFASLANNETIDLLYVMPAIAGQGAGTMLVGALEKLAAARGATRLKADVSDTAQDFFTRHGFEAQQRNTVRRGGQWLTNTTMEKKLANARAP